MTTAARRDAAAEHPLPRLLGAGGRRLRRAAGGIERRAAAWALRRQGRDGAAVTLQRRRIYILPTRYGLIFGLLVFAMLLGSLNYGASLGFALTFLLAGLALVAMHECHNNLLGLEVRFAGVQPVFAGQTAEFRIALAHAGRRPRYEIELERDGVSAGPVDVEPGVPAMLRVAVPAARRGWLALPRVAVTTRHPGRLFRAWSWLHFDARCLVYPEPAPPGRPLPADAAAAGGTGRPDAGDADFAGLRVAVPGDPPQHIAWKAYARNAELLLKQFAAGTSARFVLDWNALPDLPPEARIAQLARWCLDAESAGGAFGLRLPGTAIPLGNGQRHLHECLKALALLPTAEDDRT
ncbi:MAG TPA: DUF58 domain-containing protein [Gammaproteobacteria bacterium]